MQVDAALGSLCLRARTRSSAHPTPGENAKYAVRFSPSFSNSMGVQQWTVPSRAACVKDLQRDITNAVGLDRNQYQVALYLNCRLEPRENRASRTARAKPSLLSLPRTSAAFSSLLKDVREEYCRADVLATFLRMLRWKGGSHSFKCLLSHVGGVFAPMSRCFWERRFTQNHAVIEELCYFCCTAWPGNEHRLLYAFTHVGSRLSAPSLGRFARNMMDAATSVVDSPRLTERAPNHVPLAGTPPDILTTDCLLKSVGDAWHWRKHQSQRLPDNRHFRSMRFGNMDSPEDMQPPDDEMPDLWPHVRKHISSVASGASTEGGSSSALRKDTASWNADACTIQRTGGVWSTVTNRERRFPMAIMEVVSRSTGTTSCRGVGPFEVEDTGENVQAGAARGLAWLCARNEMVRAACPGFDCSTHRLDDEVAKNVLTGLFASEQAMCTAYRGARSWLRSVLRQASGGNELMQKDFELVLDTFKPLSDRVFSGKTRPTSSRVETFLCDDTKLLQSLYDSHQRKGGLLSSERDTVGELPCPLVLLDEYLHATEDGKQVVHFVWICPVCASDRPPLLRMACPACHLPVCFARACHEPALGFQGTKRCVGCRLVNSMRRMPSRHETGSTP